MLGEDISHLKDELFHELYVADHEAHPLLSDVFKAAVDLEQRHKKVMQRLST